MAFSLSPTAPAFAYRPDIDGLRAFAVLAVVFFHAFPSTLKGGFIGVDVFFVISGYLICGIILRDLDAGSFSFANFYSRRIRRIFPALLIVLTSLLIFGWITLFPEEYEAIAKHVLGGSLFSSNFVLWSEAGYFDKTAKLKPLLHLWSLGIEEQYYIVFPFILWYCAKKHIKAVFIIIILCCLSFLDNIYLHKINSVADFYSPVSRIWELLVGAGLSALMRHESAQRAYLKLDSICARYIYTSEQKNNGHSLSFLLAIIGSSLLGMGLLLAREGDPYPGWKALFPVIGTTFLIAAGPLNPISKYCLTNRISVFIGKISYPLYLWHWVIISCAYIVIGHLDNTTRLLRLEIIAISILLSILTYIYIEKPIRYSNFNNNIKILILIVLMISIGITGYYIKYNEGLAYRMQSDNYNEIQRIKENSKLAEKNCLNIYPDWADLNDNICRIEKDLSHTTVALIGDSYSGHLFSGISALLDKNNSAAVFPASCAAPYIDLACATRDPKHPFRKNGTFLINRSINEVLHNKNIKYIILSHNPWCSFYDIIDVSDKNITNKDIILENAMRKTFKLLTNANKEIIVILANPYLPVEPNSCRQRPHGLFNNYSNCKFKREFYENYKPISWYKSIVNKVIKDYPNVKIVDLSQILCDNEFCYIGRNGKVFYNDKGHLSIEGSLLVAPYILNKLKGL